MSKIEMKDIAKFKINSEMMFVACLYKDADLYFEYSHAKQSISHKMWKFYFSLLTALVEKKKYTKIDEYIVDTYINEQSDELKQQFKDFGGYKVIEQASYIAEIDNVNTYYLDVLKYDAVIQLAKSGFPVLTNWDMLSDLSYDQLSDFYSSKVDMIFTQNVQEDVVYDIKSKMWDMVVDADKGVNRGLPVASKLLNSIINGQVLGNITMFAAASGVGKSFSTLNLTIPTAIAQNEPLLIMCNEEDLPKWQRELITWVANNIICRKKEFKEKQFIKSRFYQGSFTKEEWEILKLAQTWIDEKVEDGLIKFVSFNSFSMGKAIKLIKKYSKRDIKYFIIDTLKLDNDNSSKINDLSWLQLQQNMVKLYNEIKEKKSNVHVWVTYQLSKNQARFLDQTKLGISKNVADVASTLILTRKVLLDEKSGGKNELKVENAKGDKIVLDPSKDYFIIFIDKNRMGGTSRQVIFEIDMGRNVIRDVGLTYVPEDF
ncbi:DnaB-like helicase C-terminal domain-containing protein [Enterococcus sp. N249-2]